MGEHRTRWWDGTRWRGWFDGRGGPEPSMTTRSRIKEQEARRPASVRAAGGPEPSMPPRSRIKEQEARRPASVSAADLVRPGWYPDQARPLTRVRYWDGSTWTPWVSDDGSPTEAPLPTSWDRHSRARRRSLPFRLLCLGALMALTSLPILVVGALLGMAGTPGKDPAPDLQLTVGALLVIGLLLFFVGVALAVVAVAWWGVLDFRTHPRHSDRFVGAVKIAGGVAAGWLVACWVGSFLD
jgi:hypothetical protein